MLTYVVMKRFLERGIILSGEVLVKILSQAYEQKKTLPIVSFSSFFEQKKVGFRLNNDVSADIIYHTLTCIQRKTCVQDVLVEVLKVDSPNNDGAFSDCVYILANGTNQQVKEWVQPLHPKRVTQGYQHVTPIDAPQLKNDYHVFAVTWS